MATAPGLDAAPLWLGSLDRTRRLAYGVGERFEVVVRRLTGIGVGRKPQDVPAPRRGQPLGVELAQVITVRLGVYRQRAENGRLIGVHVRQRGDGLARAGST